MQKIDRSFKKGSIKRRVKEFWGLCICASSIAVLGIQMAILHYIFDIFAHTHTHTCTCTCTCTNFA
jgi:hypothetical protein